MGSSPTQRGDDERRTTSDERSIGKVKQTWRPPRRRNNGKPPRLEDWFIRLLWRLLFLLPRLLVPLHSLCEERPSNKGRRLLRKLLRILLAAPVSRGFELLRWLLWSRRPGESSHASPHRGQKKNAEGSL